MYSGVRNAGNAVSAGANLNSRIVEVGEGGGGLRSQSLPSPFWL